MIIVVCCGGLVSCGLVLCCYGVWMVLWWEFYVWVDVDCYVLWCGLVVYCYVGDCCDGVDMVIIVFWVVLYCFLVDEFVCVFDLVFYVGLVICLVLFVEFDGS